MQIRISAIWLLVEFSVGTVIFSLLFLAPEIRRSFHRFNFLTAAVIWLLIVGLVWPLDTTATVLALVATASSSMLAWSAHRGEAWRPSATRTLTALAIQLLCAAKVASLEFSAQTGKMLLITLNLVTGTALLGAVHVGMILGHWYLIMRNLSFQHLIRASRLFLTALIVRTVWTAAQIALADVAMRERWLGEEAMFVMMRGVWGLAMPLALACFTLRLAKTKNNQAATGMLYVCEFCVLGGEAMASYLGM